MEMILSALGILLISGVLVKKLGGADTVKEGMAKVCKVISDFWSEGNSFPANISRSIDDYNLAGLTRKLEPLFDVLILENACENVDWLSIVYRKIGGDTDIDIIELIFRNFLKEYFNLPADYPLHIFVEIDEDRIYLNCAYSEKGRQIIQTQRNNQRSRCIGSNHDLME